MKEYYKGRKKLLAFDIFLTLVSLLLIFGLPSLQAQTVKWNEVKEVAGYKLYWQLVENCNDNSAIDFTHSVNVGAGLSYDLGNDFNFQLKELYQIKMTAYNKRGLESLQSNVVACVEINGLPELVTEITIKKKEE